MIGGLGGDGGGAPAWQNPYPTGSGGYAPPANPLAPIGGNPSVSQTPPNNPLTNVDYGGQAQPQGGSYLRPARPDLPVSPNIYGTAQQQIGFGQQVQGLNAVNQQGVFGGAQYQRDPVTGGITGVNTGLNSTFSDVANGLLGGLGTRPGDVSDAVYGQYSANLDPQWQTMETELNNRLINQGIPQGSDAWNQARDQFNRERSAAYLQANQAAQEAGGQEQSRLLGGLLDVGGAATQGFQSTPSIATPSTGAYTYANFGAAQDAYNQQLASYNSAMNGLFGLGGQAIGGISDWLADLLN